MLESSDSMTCSFANIYPGQIIVVLYSAPFLHQPSSSSAQGIETRGTVFMLQMAMPCMTLIRWDKRSLLCIASCVPSSLYASVLVL